MSQQLKVTCECLTAGCDHAIGQSNPQPSTWERDIEIIITPLEDANCSSADIRIFKEKLLRIFHQVEAQARKEERKKKDEAYWERNQLVVALSKIYPSWLGYHKGKDWEDDWRTIVYIKIPTKELEQKYVQGGFEVKYERQLSWHIHNDDKKYFTHLDPGLEEWDGHTTEEKYRRLSCLKV